MSINLQTKVKQNPEIPTVDLDGEMGLMNPKKGNYYATNGIGGMIWKMLEQPIVVSAIVGELLKEYEITREVCEHEVLTYIENMYEEELILIEKA